MKIHFFSVVICSLIIVCCFQNNKEPSYEQRVEAYIKEQTELNVNLEIENTDVYIGFDSVNIFNIKQLNHKFFFYFSIQTCSPCIEQTVDCIKEVFPDYENDNEIFFISPDYPARFKGNCYGKPLLTLDSEKLGIPVEKLNVPFIFVIDSNLKIKKMHIVNKNDFRSTVKFLKELVKKQKGGN